MHGLAGVSIPVAVAGDARGQRDDEILQAGGKATLGTHMFKQQECSAGFEHALYFAQAVRGIADGAEHQRSDHAVKGAISKGQLLGNGPR